MTREQTLEALRTKLAKSQGDGFTDRRRAIQAEIDRLEARQDAPDAG